MKYFFNSLLYFLILLSFENSAYSLSENQIKKICQKKQNEYACFKNLKLKKFNLLRGNRIEIPVIPFKK